MCVVIFCHEILYTRQQLYHSNELIITLVTTAAADIAVQYVERTELHYGQYEMVIDLENPSTMQIKYAAVFVLFLHVTSISCISFYKVRWYALYIL